MQMLVLKKNEIWSFVKIQTSIGSVTDGRECVLCMCVSYHKTQNGTIFRLNTALFSLHNSEVSLNITDLTVVTVALNNTFTDTRISHGSYLQCHFVISCRKNTPYIPASHFANIDSIYFSS